MLKNKRNNWRNRVKNVLRSRHYQWLAECRDGDPVPDVVRDVATDLMHLCREAGLEWDRVLAQSRAQYSAEAGEPALRN